MPFLTPKRAFLSKKPSDRWDTKRADWLHSRFSSPEIVDSLKKKKRLGPLCELSSASVIASIVAYLSSGIEACWYCYERDIRTCPNVKTWHNSTVFHSHWCPLRDSFLLKVIQDHDGYLFIAGSNDDKCCSLYNRQHVLLPFLWHQIFSTVDHCTSHHWLWWVLVYSVKPAVIPNWGRSCKPGMRAQVWNTATAVKCIIDPLSSTHSMNFRIIFTANNFVFSLISKFVDVMTKEFCLLTFFSRNNSSHKRIYRLLQKNSVVSQAGPGR